MAVATGNEDGTTNWADYGMWTSYGGNNTIGMYDTNNDGVLDEDDEIDLEGYAWNMYEPALFEGFDALKNGKQDEVRVFVDQITSGITLSKTTTGVKILDKVIANRYEITPSNVISEDGTLGIQREVNGDEIEEANEIGPRGLYDATFTYGIPLYIGGASFLWNEALCDLPEGECAYEAFDGLASSDADHGVYIDIEPITGAAMRGAERMMGALQVNKGLLFPHIQGEMYHPVFYVTKTGVLKQKQADDFSKLYDVIDQQGMLTLVGILVGVILLAVGVGLGFKGVSAGDKVYAAGDA